MPAYKYIAIDKHGKQKTGILESDQARQARQQLRQQGLSPIEVKLVTAVKKGSSKPLFAPTLSASELSLLTRQLATLVRAALPLDESIYAVSQQSESAKIQMILMSVRSDILAGKALAQAMAEFPKVFKKDYLATVAAGEQSGDLAIVFERLADHVERSQALRQKILGALLYPIILSVIAISVVIGLLTYVVPQIVQVFDNIDQDLPDLTRTLINLSNFLQQYGLLLAIAIVALGSVVYMALQKPVFKYQWHKILLSLPLISPLIRTLNSARFCRTLGTLLMSGVPMLQALEIAAKVVTLLPMHRTVTEAIQSVREGSSLSKSLRQGSGTKFPPLTLHLISSGEASGQLDNMLEKASETQERELESWISSFLTLLEPLLLLTMGGVVLTIVLAIMLPIFNLNQLAG